MHAQKSGVALILAVGIISVLSVLALGLSLSNRVELRAAENYRGQTQAEYIAKAALAQGIRELKYGESGAQLSPYDTAVDPGYYRGNAAWENAAVDIATSAATHPSFDNLNGIRGDGISGVFSNGTYRLKIIDCAARININTPLPEGDVDAANDFITILRGLGMSQTQALSLIAFRKSLPGGIFTTRQELKIVPGIEDISNFEDFITCYGNADTGAEHSRRVFVNVNTAHKKVLQAVLAAITAPYSPSGIVDEIHLRRNLNPFDGLNPDDNVKGFSSARGEFTAFLRYLRAIDKIPSDTLLAEIVQQTDPNRNATNTTHFSFDSGGWYEIEALGQFQGAQKTVEQAVRIYEKIYETTKTEFSDCDPKTARVTWKNSCPVNYDCLEHHETQPHETDPHGLHDVQVIPHALKLGFWDNFSEDYDDSGSQTGDWIAVQESFEINAGGSGMLRTWPASGFISPEADYFPEVMLNPDTWQLTEFSLRARLIDEAAYEGTTLAKTLLRDHLPWPAVPLGAYWSNAAPLPTAENCPDIADNTVTAETMYIKSWHAHERFLNVTHLKFGLGAIYCNYPQTTDIATSTIDLYSNWVNYDGSGYIYFAPGPDIKPFDVISRPHIMVFCNDWLWWAWWGWHNPIDGTLTQLLPEYRPDRTIFIKVSGGLYYTDPFGVYNSGQVHAVIYNADGVTDFLATEALMDYQGRVIRAVGMGSLFDMDNVRIIPRQGVYTSKTIFPTTPFEWGTISAGVSLPDEAPEATTKVFVTTNFSAGESVSILPGPDVMPPAGALTPAGGTISLVSDTALNYRVYLYADYLVSTFGTEFKKIPVVEDVTITYLPHTEIGYQTVR